MCSRRNPDRYMHGVAHARACTKALLCIYCSACWSIADGALRTAGAWPVPVARADH